ncbi:MAG: hypothetical protein KDH96_10495, partial [Candidatus Riesia sp.]|nr:hypothetical protein [Candidatus Riesia sp.]
MECIHVPLVYIDKDAKNILKDIIHSTTDISTSKCVPLNLMTYHSELYNKAIIVNNTEIIKKSLLARNSYEIPTYQQNECHDSYCDITYKCIDGTDFSRISITSLTLRIDVKTRDMTIISKIVKNTENNH